MQGQSNKLDHLDLLRALCILAVYVHHINHNGIWGQIGVSAFFMLSGYLLLGNHFLSIESGKTQPVIEFQRKRLLRILPAYFFTLFMCWLAVDVAPWLPLRTSPEIFNAAWPYFLTFTTNLWIAEIGHKWPGAYSHLWSLAIEQWFYVALMPAFMWLKTTRLQAAIFALFLLGILAWRASNELPIITLYTSFELNFPLMIFGGIMRRGITTPMSLKRESILAATFIFAATAFYQSANQHLLTLLQTVAAGALFLIFVGNGRLANSKLKNAYTLHLGKVSYGFYLYHYLIAFPKPAVIIQEIGIKLPLMATGYKVLHHALIVLIVTGLASLSYRYLEEPFLKLKDKKHSK